jgi:hypothetical protein
VSNVRFHTPFVALATAAVAMLGPVAAPAAAQAVTVTEAPAPVTLRRPDLGLSLRSPRGFVPANPAQVPDGVGLLNDRPGGSASMAVVVRPAPADLPALKRADALARALAKSEPAFRLESTDAARVAGGDAAVVMGALRPEAPNGPVLKTCTVAVVHQERLFLFTLTAEAKQWRQAAQDFLTSVESVKWLD